MKGYRFLVDGPVPENHAFCVSTRDLPLTFKTLLASVDVIMTKPGYGTIVEAVALKQPVVYVRRYTFADEEALVDFLHRYGRGVELSREDFYHARWETAFDTSHSAALAADSIASRNRSHRGGRIPRFSLGPPGMMPSVPSKSCVPSRS